MLNWLYNLFSKTSGVLLITILIICLAIGVFLLVKSADIFVSGASQLARKLKIPTIIIGLTIVSFGTSAPEASVSINAALSGSADLSIGNVVGSNICNILLVLGLPALLAPIVVNKKEMKKDIYIMIASSSLLLLFCLFFSTNGNKSINFIEGLILFVGIILYVIYNVFNARKKPNDDLNTSSIETPEETTTTEEETKPRKTIVVILILLLGLLGVLIGGDLVTYSASNIALQMGISEALIGLTIVAFCTSLPELVTTFVAARKNENDIAIGNVVGSNIFNILFILGMSAMITPLYFDPIVIIDVVIALALSIGILLIFRFKGQIKRNLGMLMILGYVLYLTYLILREFSIL